MSLLVSTFQPQAPKPPSQWVMSPLHLLSWPWQVPVVEPSPLVWTVLVGADDEDDEDDENEEGDEVSGGKDPVVGGVATGSEYAVSIPGDEKAPAVAVAA